MQPNNITGLIQNFLGYGQQTNAVPNQAPVQPIESLVNNLQTLGNVQRFKGVGSLNNAQAGGIRPVDSNIQFGQLGNFPYDRSGDAFGEETRKNGELQQKQYEASEKMIERLNYLNNMNNRRKTRILDGRARNSPPKTLEELIQNLDKSETKFKRDFPDFY